MTQPPLTQAIAQLERLLEVRLFERTKRSVQLTEAGAALLPQARDLLARAQALPAQARAAAGGEPGRLRLGFVSTAGFSAAARLGARLPRRASARAAGTGRGHRRRAAARAGTRRPRRRLPAAFARLRAGGLEHLRVQVEPLVLAMPEQHPLATAARWPCRACWPSRW
jgi:DNA-binding transcriptional LysR family regulator